MAWGSASTVDVLLRHAAASSPAWLARMLNSTQYISHRGEAEPRPQLLLLDVSEAESLDNATRQPATPPDASDLMPAQTEKASVSDNSVTSHPFLRRICSRTLMGWFVSPSKGAGGGGEAPRSLLLAVAVAFG